MPTYVSTVTVNAPADQVLAFLRDIDNQHTWFPGNSESAVLDRDANGQCSKARLTNDVKVAKDTFELDYTHNDQGFSWILTAPTKIQKVNTGSWTVLDKGGKAEASYELTLETTLPLPGFVQRKTVKDTAKNATSALVKQF
jgi:ribosome-associated toxin RatA of RatAB toxin-antitoxin module